MRAGMMASRLYRRERVIPPLTDHSEHNGGVDRPRKYPFHLWQPSIYYVTFQWGFDHQYL